MPVLEHESPQGGVSRSWLDQMECGPDQILLSEEPNPKGLGARNKEQTDRAMAAE